MTGRTAETNGMGEGQTGRGKQGREGSGGGTKKRTNERKHEENFW